jgi:hypothetical protein
MTEWTGRELDMARKGYVYHKDIVRGGQRVVCRNLTGKEREWFVFDHDAYDAHNKG